MPLMMGPSVPKDRCTSSSTRTASSSMAAGPDSASTALSKAGGQRSPEPRTPQHNSSKTSLSRKAAMTDDICEVIITAPDQEWLVSFTRQLIADRLAASSHHTPIRSVYTWQGQIEDTT